MKIAVIGTGKMGRGFATALSPRRKVVFGTRDPVKAAKIVRATGAASASSYEEAAAGSEIFILAVPWKAMDEVLPALGKIGKRTNNRPYEKKVRLAN